MDNAPAFIDIRIVSKEYRVKGAASVLALDGVSLKVAPKEFCCIVGRSGCGKSTLLSLVAGLRTPTDGEVYIGGRVVTGPGPDRALVFQDAGLFPWRTALGNVTFGLEMSGITKRERVKRALDLLEVMGLDKFRDKYPGQLSGGMAQRVNLARALAVDPEVLLMDEPFAAVDAITREHLQDYLLDVWAVKRKTILFITHSVDEAVYLGDRIVVLSSRPGRVSGVIDIDEPRPRDRSSQTFAEHCATIHALLGDRV